MNKVTVGIRILLGLVFFVFGLNGFIHFIPQPPMAGDIATFFTGLTATGYFLPLLSGTQTICGALLLSGFYVPLALIVLAPVILNIFLVHAFMDTSGLPIALIVGAFEVYLSFFSKEYSPTVKKIFVAKP